MNVFPITWMGVGSGAAAMVARIARDRASTSRPIAVDTDVLALNACEAADVLLIGESRFEGAGAGGQAVNGRMAALDDSEKLKRTLMDTRLLVVLTCLGGGTGSGATPEILKLARRMGARSLCFATQPFRFESPEVRAQAERALPRLEEAADSLVLVPSDALYAGALDVPIAAAQEQAAQQLGAGVLLLHRLLSAPGHIRLGPGALCRLLAEVGGRCRFAAAEAQGENRVARAVSALCASPLLGGEAHDMSSAGGLVLGVLGSDDLRLKEIGDVMDALRESSRPDLTMRLGTVLDPALAGKLALVALVFERWQAATPERAAAPVAELGDTFLRVGASRRRKRVAESLLSFGPSGRGRFQGVAPTVLDNEDLDIPTYQRRGLALEH